MPLSDTQILDLRAARAAKVNDANALLELAKTETRDLSPEESEKFDKLHVDADKDLKTIEREEKQSMANRSLESLATVIDSPTDIARRDGAGGLELPDTEKAAATHKRNSELVEWCRSGQFDRRSLTTSSDLNGGLLIPPDTSMYGNIVTAMKAFGFPEDLCTVLNTADGRPLPIPTVNDTFNIATAIAEAQCPNPAPDVQFGTVTLNAYKWGTGVLQVSTELVQDAVLDIDTFVGGRLGERMGRIKAYLLTVGSGAGQPQGILTGSTLGVTAASETAVAYNEILNLIHSVDPAYRGNANFMFHDTTLLALKKLTDSQGRPLYLPGLALKEPDTLNGVPWIVQQSMPQIGPGNKSILYGNFKNFYIRNVQGFAVQRLNELYAACGMIGFFGFTRFDSVVVDAGTHPLKYLQQAA